MSEGENKIEEKLRSAAIRILILLAQGNYKALADLTEPGPARLTDADIARAANDYPGTMRLPRFNELVIDAVEVRGSSPRIFLVDTTVFTVEEGASDLTARLEVIDGPDDDYELKFYDLLVK